MASEFYKIPNLFEPYRELIYTTARTSIVDMVCSHLIACKFDGWIFTSGTDIPKIDRMTFDPSHRDSIISMHSCLTDINTLTYVHDWLSTNSIEYTPLTYESMDEYIKNNWGNVTQTQWAATGYDYSKIFTNYKLIGSYIANYAKRMK